MPACARFMLTGGGLSCLLIVVVQAVNIVDGIRFQAFSATRSQGNASHRTSQQGSCFPPMAAGDTTVGS